MTGPLADRLNSPIMKTLGGAGVPFASPETASGGAV
jgi:hypothetical protein